MILRDALYYIFKIIFKIFYYIFFRYEVKGVENIPTKGGVIIASNHLSYLDPPLIGIAINRKAIFIAKWSLFKNPLIGWFVSLYSLPVDKYNPKPSTIKNTVKALKDGKVVVIFPEGGRSINGKLGKGMKGIGMIALLSKAPVVPALIEGTDKALPIGAKFFKPYKVRVTFGTPIVYNKNKVVYNKKDSSKKIQQEITEEIMLSIKMLKGR